MTKRRILFIIATVLVLVLIGAWMMVIGRGHTVYFDNKTTEYNGQEIASIRRINVFMNGEQIAKLSARERGMGTVIGQKVSFSLEVQREKGADPELYDYTLKLPYSIDGIVVNLPALLEGLPEEAWMSEFVPVAVVEEDVEDVELDEFGLDVEMEAGAD